MSDRRRVFWQGFGPGLVWAAAAIGVSHLVQSTRAGAEAGYALIWIILLALILKYPFFEYGPRYAAATGESLVEGYQRVGRWALWIYFVITLLTALIIESAVVLFTAFLVRYAFGLELSVVWTGGLIVGASALLLAIGRYRGLDFAVKVILALLGLSTLIGAILILGRTPASTFAPWPMGASGETVTFAFLLALVGWMPSAIDISVWSSLWTLAKNEASGTRCTVESALLDFRIGYVATGILAFAFLTLGAGVMYASGTAFSPRGTGFSVQLVDLYSQSFGAWMRPVVLVAVVTTMISTSLTVVDGFPRAIARTVVALFRGTGGSWAAETRIYWFALIIFGVLTLVVLKLFMGTMTTMVDVATIISFLTAPILGYINLRAVTGPHMPPAHRPGRRLLFLSYVGLVLLGGTAVFFLFTRLT